MLVDQNEIKALICWWGDNQPLLPCESRVAAAHEIKKDISGTQKQNMELQQP
jgi:hypothetical protein